MKLKKIKTIIIRENDFDFFKKQKNIKIISVTSGKDGKDLIGFDKDKKQQIFRTFKRLIIKYEKYSDISYPDLVSHLIGEKYDINSQIAIIRQRVEKPDEFSSFFTYCEQCKAEAKQFVVERDNIEN